MNKAGWKVVRRRDGAFCSAVIKEGPWCCRYIVGERTVGIDDTPILAFTTRAAARRFRHYNVLPGGGHVIFRANLENPRPQKTIAPNDWHPEFKRFWDGRLYSVNAAPEGTLACDAITLLAIR